MDNSQELLTAVNEIRDLVRIMAEPAVAEKDKKARAELRRLIGNSPKKAQAVLLMDGSRIQSVIQKETGINQGDLSSLVRKLKDSRLLAGDGKQPKLAIAIPKTFFEEQGAE